MVHSCVSQRVLVSVTGLRWFPLPAPSPFPGDQSTLPSGLKSDVCLSFGPVASKHSEYSRSPPLRVPESHVVVPHPWHSHPPVQRSGSPSSGIRHDWVLGKVPLSTEGGKLEACPPRQEVGRERQGESRGRIVSDSLPRPYAFPRLVAAARCGPCQAGGGGTEGLLFAEQQFP